MTPQSPSSASAVPAQQAGSLAVRAGTLEVRLARDAGEIAAAQALRYRVFYQEMGAHPTGDMAATRRDVDAFDAFCDHLLVFDHARGEGDDAVVGTYRLIRREAASRIGRFYSAAEYDVRCIADYPGAVLELGRSCIDARWRNRPTMQLLWHGIAAYVFDYGIELMFGCASLPGTDPGASAVPLSYLYHRHLAPPTLRPRALADRYVAMNRLPADAFDPAEALNHLPPLLKGYLRLGGFVGDGAVVDRQFNTIDVCVVVKTDLVTEKYYRHYERRARAVAAV